MLDSVIRGDTLLWIGTQGTDIVTACTTDVMQRPRCKVLVLTWCGGKDVDTWLEDGLATVERYAKDIGCSHLEIFGRKGWSRKLNSSWKHGITVYRKEVS